MQADTVISNLLSPRAEEADGMVEVGGSQEEVGLQVNCATDGETSKLATCQQLRPRWIYLLRNKTAECNFTAFRASSAASGSSGC